MKAFVCINPLAGDFSKLKNTTRIRKLLTREGFEFELFISEYKDHIKEVVSKFDKSILDKFDSIIVVGGDGTMSEVFSGLAISGIHDLPVGIIPMGTGNDLARSLNIPLNYPIFALRIIKLQKMKPIDMCRINNDYFVNYVGFGLDGQVISYKKFQKSLLPKRLSFIKPIIQALKQLKTYKYHLKIDGHEEVLEGINLIVTNIPTYSAGIRLYPEAEINDKIFEITFLRKLPSAGNIALLPVMHSKLLRKDKDFIQFQASELEISFSDSVPFIQVDGDHYETNRGDFKLKFISESINVFCNV